MKLKAAAILLTLMLVFATASSDSVPRTFAPGGEVPDFELTDLNGKTRPRSDLQKEAGESGVIVLTFWCTTCHSCRDIERKLDKLASDYHGKAAIFALDSNAGETAAKVKAFTEARGLKLPVLLDPGAKIADLFGAKVTTTTLIIDRQGVLRYRGQFGRGQQVPAEEALKEVLAGKNVTVSTTKEFG